MEVEQGRDQVSGIVAVERGWYYLHPMSWQVCLSDDVVCTFYGLSSMWHVQMCRLLSIWIGIGRPQK